jgi:hypothetical protein
MITLRPEAAAAFVGKIACFYELQGAVVQGLPKGGAKKLVGQVVSAKPWADADPGAIPNALLTVRGRSGKTKDVNLVEQYAALFDTWAEALEEQTRP